MNHSGASNGAARQPFAVFSDFDGTIAHPDTLNFLTERFAGNEFRRQIGKRDHYRRVDFEGRDPIGGCYDTRRFP